MNIHEVSINRREALFTDANPMLLAIPGSNCLVPISQNKESNILGTVFPTTSSPGSETEQRHTKTKRKPQQNTTSEIAERIKALVPKIERGETTIEKAALECGVSHQTLRGKLQALKSGKDLINAAATEDPQVPMTPVKLPDAELLTYLSRSE